MSSGMTDDVFWIQWPRAKYMTSTCSSFLGQTQSSCVFHGMSVPEARERILYANFLQPGREGHKRGSAHVCEEMRLERLYLSVYSDVIKTEGATPYDAAPSDE